MKFGAILFLSLLFSNGIWSQCATITCPANITVDNDSAQCGAYVSYDLPIGIDVCQSFSDTLNYSGAIVQWTVPAGINQITIEARGAAGGNGGGSPVPAGLGASMQGEFAVTPGQVLNILVGQQNNAGNGGGGGTFVVDAMNTPLIIAGGGGGAADTWDSPSKHGQITTFGGTGYGSGGVGGTNGNGGQIGTPFSSGAGGGLLTNGADGWTGGSGGQAFVNGGAGANVGYGIGGFGGGGNGSGSVVGGGGGGYSGGGSGTNATGGGVPGGGGSINNGINQINASGVNSGSGRVIIAYFATSPVSMTLGSTSGSFFPIGTTTQNYVTYITSIDSATCTFSVTVIDTLVPVINVPANITSCDPAPTGLVPTIDDNCPGGNLTFTLSGATTASGSGDASGTVFNVGVTTLTYTFEDVSGNADTNSMDVTILPLPTVTLASVSPNTVCVDANPFALPVGTPAGGTYASAGLSGGDFDPTLAGIGSHYITYSYADSSGCSNADSVMVAVAGLPSVMLAPLAQDTVCINASAFALPVGTPAGGTYAGTGIAGGNFDPSLAGIGAHSVTYTYADSSGCSSADSVTIVVDGCVSVNELTLSDAFAVYPNPSTGKYTVAYSNTTNAQVTLRVLDVQGRVLIENTSNETIIQEKVDISDATNGVYFIELRVGATKLVEKIIKQ